jgi:hypothetical protein
MRFFLIFLLLPLQLFSQDLEGVWTGTIYNDTTRKYIPYEIAISGTKGKLSGYSHTIFSGDNNIQETGLKSVKIKKKGDKILVEDDELIYNNYTTPPPKGVRQYSVLTFTSGPEGEYLVGAFNTNRTKEYASATGTINLKKKEKLTDTKVIPKLDELKLANSLSFMQPKPEEKKDIAIVSPPIKEKTASQPVQQQKDVAVNLPKTKKEPVKIEKDENLIDIDEDTVDYKVDVVPTEDIGAPKKPKNDKVKVPVLISKKTEPLPELKKELVTAPVKKPTVIEPKKEVVTIPVKEEKKPLPPQVKDKPATVPVQQTVNKPAVIPQTTPKENVKTNTPVKRTDTAVTVVKEKIKEPVMTQVPKPVQNLPVVSGPVISSEALAKRKIETIRSVDIKSDSIVLTLYDNGEVDGDIVSVILNGKIIMSNQRLSTIALTKTIYITPDLGDSLQLIMYAENLGTIAPNTGLLIIKDGAESYQIRFSGDLQKNSAIILRRKNN